MNAGGRNPVMSRAAIAGSAAFLVYGGWDVLLATAAFCIVWRAGLPYIQDNDMTTKTEDQDAADRIRRIATRAHDQAKATAGAPPAVTTPPSGKDAGDAVGERPSTGPADEAATQTRVLSGHPGIRPEDLYASVPPRSDSPRTLPRFANLCSEIPFPARIDPAACADAMMASGFARSRTLEAFRRARMEASVGEPWAAEVREGESMVDTMTRVIAEGMPQPSRIAVLSGPSIEDMRIEFDALPPLERADEIQRHLWAMQDGERVRTRFSPLLNAIGIS